ncbi:uncharacterized protein LY79DRAFT_584229 [Colletotrichum navitas]|uniref:Uncharacterized protein n=1 Tax=Colletotrichum navitas TaxID=681940 RepID=A0AAD8UX75_9PEZI|nr:uncharacterized protein LY79DRAFT_584229 [Colletotrichum navitas]KAK1570150.1 hypothetical protein LY79DRAFT_584229 [Colletotrichum navitas]
MTFVHSIVIVDYPFYLHHEQTHAPATGGSGHGPDAQSGDTHMPGSFNPIPDRANARRQGTEGNTKDVPPSTAPQTQAAQASNDHITAHAHALGEPWTAAIDVLAMTLKTAEVMVQVEIACSSAISECLLFIREAKVLLEIKVRGLKSLKLKAYSKVVLKGLGLLKAIFKTI